MLSNLLPWIVAGAALAAAAALYSRLRQIASLASSKQIEVDKLLGELKSTREQMERSAAKQRRSADELGELRKKLEKLKKRTSKGPGAAAGPPAQLQTHETELEQARQSRDAARQEAESLGKELSRMRSERAEAAAAATPAAEPLLDNAAIEALQARAGVLEDERSKLKAELATGREKIERLRGKAKTQDMLYASMRGELDAKKDRLRGQQEELERLRAMQVVVGAIAPPDAGSPESGLASAGEAGAASEVHVSAAPPADDEGASPS